MTIKEAKTVLREAQENKKPKTKAEIDHIKMAIKIVSGARLGGL